MMNIKNPFKNKAFKLSLIIAAILSLVYLVLRLAFFPSDPVLPFFNTVYLQYLYLPEALANQLFKLSDAGVIIKDHVFIFEGESVYQLARNNFFDNWQKFLLNKNWSLLILVLVWGTISPIKKKIIFSFLFLITHYFSVVSGMYLLGVTGPVLYEIKPSFFLSPTLIGTFLMYSLLSVWLFVSKNEILNTLQKIKINIKITNRKIIEILILFFFLLLLRSFVIAFFDFPHYVNFLLAITREISSIFGYYGYINGDQLIGENGALALSKHCLGFMSMFLFAALVYLTRLKNKRVTWIFMLSGLGAIFLSNLIRLIAIFIVAQGENGFERANRHHEVYNVVIYVLIFVLWVVWFEFFVLKGRREG
ncbi:MAG: exosortase/archaeosortase family protein [Bacteroidales bacterium]|nr:exosortase/archaeosortase family protein [Bacteroidales bacterium]MCF8390287.1 exosortase/archaeosortase family protein [Bacteroidales bacterium]